MQVNPCPLTAFTTNGVDQSITYVIGEAAISTNPYGQTTQVNACNYPVTTDIAYDPALPGYITYNEPGRIYRVNQITDDGLANVFKITVTH